MWIVYVILLLIGFFGFCVLLAYIETKFGSNTYNKSIGKSELKNKDQQGQSQSLLSIFQSLKGNQ